MTICRKCGRAEGHYLNCQNAPGLSYEATIEQEAAAAAAPPVEEPTESVCAEEECEEPTKSARARYCTEHSTVAASNARQYKKKQKENTDG